MPNWSMAGEAVWSAGVNLWFEPLEHHWVIKLLFLQYVAVQPIV